MLQRGYCRHHFALVGESSRRGHAYVRQPNMLLTQPLSRPAIYIALPARGHALRPCHDVRLTDSKYCCEHTNICLAVFSIRLSKTSCALPANARERARAHEGAAIPISRMTRVECCPPRTRVQHHGALTARPPHGAAQGLGRYAEHATRWLIQLDMYARE